MKQTSPWFSEEQGEQQSDEQETEMDDTQKLGAIKSECATSTITGENIAPVENTENTDIPNNHEEVASETSTTLETSATQNLVPAEEDGMPTASSVSAKEDLPEDVPTEEDISYAPVARLETAQKGGLSRGRSLLFSVFLLVVIINAANMGAPQFIGAQGWAFVLGGSTSTSDPNLLKDVVNKLHHTPTPGIKTQATPQVITPEGYINAIINNMTLDEKLGQMMIVQFYGPDYGLEISTMISQYKVGAVLIFAANDNIVSKPQLKGLIHQMQVNSTIPLITAIDQEGGTVDRLLNLDGPRPSAASIGVTNDPSKAMAEGIQDAKDLSYYGFNLNLAPVVDVTNVYNPQLYLRTYGNNSMIVTKMAGAYLQGLQKSGKVIGALKHFPGLGDVGGDPHITVPSLYRTERALSAIDWAPYRTLIAQGNVQAVMVTHEIVTKIDSSKPSSLSYKIVTGILRNQLGFHGVIMTDSLTMEGIIAYYTEAQAAALAVEAGSDLLMGASTPNGVADMINGIKQAISAGDISQQRIDDSVRRILMLKYQMGLLKIPGA